MPQDLGKTWVNGFNLRLPMLHFAVTRGSLPQLCHQVHMVCHKITPVPAGLPRVGIHRPANVGVASAQDG